MSKSHIIILLLITLIASSSPQTTDKSLIKTLKDIFTSFPEISKKFKSTISEVFPQFQSILSLTTLKDSNEDFKCQLCHGLTSSIRETILEKFDFKPIIEILKLICGIDSNYIMCSNRSDQYDEIKIRNYIKRILNEENFCHLINACYTWADEEDTYDFANTVLKNKPKKDREKIVDYTHKLKMVQFNDMHIDLEYRENATVFCDDDTCCHEKASEYSRIKAGKFASIQRCDIPRVTFESAVNKAFELQPDFIVLLGDNSPHSYNLTQKMTYGYAEIIRDVIEEKFGGNIPVYPVLGNHETIPIDMFRLDEHEFLNNISSIYENFFANDTQAFESFRKYGYYTTKFSSKLRIVAMNCLLCSVRNFHAVGYNHILAKHMYQWLYNIMLEAEKNNEFVYILDHFPINADYNIAECGKRMQAIIDRFSYNIRGYFSGHTHNDDIVEVGEYFEPRPVVTVNYVAPGLSTFAGKIPSFRVFEIDEETYNLIDYHQYRMNVSTSIDEVKWDLAYKATELFDVKDLTYIEKIVSIDVTKSDYIWRRYTDTGDREALKKDKEEVKTALCTIHSMNYVEYHECVNGFGHFDNWVHGEWPNKG